MENDKIWQSIHLSPRQYLSCTGCPWHHQQYSLCCLLVSVSKRQKLIVVLTAAAASKLYIHSDIVTVGVYEILPKTTEKKNLYEKSSCTQADEYGKKKFFAVWSICCECFLSMCANAWNDQEPASDRRVSLCKCATLRKIPSFIDINSET